MIVGTTAAVAGAGITSVSQYQQGKAEQRLNNFNAAVNDQTAKDKERDGRIIANAQRDRNAKIQSRQRALYAKGGVLAETGSPLMLQAQQAGELELAALEIERTANVQSAQLRTQAVIDRMAGKSARRAGNLGAAGTILQGAGNAAMSYAYGKSSGAIGG